MLMFLGIVAGHSDNVAVLGEACAYPDDVTYTITETVISGDGMDAEGTIRLPEEHIGLVMNLLRNALLGNIEIRQARAGGSAVANADGCQGPAVRIIRDNLYRVITGRPQLSENEMTRIAEAYPAETALAETDAAPRETADYPVFATDWRPFVDSCMADRRQRHMMSGSEPSYRDVLICTCAEYITQVAGNPSLHSLFTQNWNSGMQVSTPKSPRWIEMWNNLCSGEPEDSPQIAVQHADEY